MTRKRPNPAFALSRFMQAIHEDYMDRGMPDVTAKARMYDDTLEQCLKLMKQEQSIPDHALVISAQFFSSALTQRGGAIAKKLQACKDEEQIPHLRLALQQIKSCRDAVDELIKTYRGEEHGQKK